MAISIHAPPRGATQGHCASSAGGYFNSRPSARGDGTPRDNLRIVALISIHAPPRGATFGSCRRRYRKPNFNSRPSARGDSASRQCRASALFQFTPLREGRLGIPTVPCIRLISIHAPPRGATERLITAEAERNISIHAPPRGATAKNMWMNRMQCLFQFTPLREGRPTSRLFRTKRRNFNSRPSARGDATT